MPALNWGKKVDISGILSVCQEQEETGWVGGGCPLWSSMDVRVF